MKSASTPPPPEEPLATRRRQTKGAELDLPDAPDFVSRRRTLSLEQLLVILEERRRWFPLTPAMAEIRRQRRVFAEFTL